MYQYKVSPELCPLGSLRVFLGLHPVTTSPCGATVSVYFWHTAQSFKQKFTINLNIMSSNYQQIISIAVLSDSAREAQQLIWVPAADSWFESQLGSILQNRYNVFRRGVCAACLLLSTVLAAVISQSIYLLISVGHQQYSLNHPLGETYFQQRIY